MMATRGPVLPPWGILLEKVVGEGVLGWRGVVFFRVDHSESQRCGTTGPDDVHIVVALFGIVVAHMPSKVNGLILVRRLFHGRWR
jgi:hypothetical protein